jgi:transcriptional regulator with PAS, ATPase and Fis domain
MPTSSQSKLLRVLQEHAIRPVGGLTEIPVNVRVVAATNRSLPEEIKTGTVPPGSFLPSGSADYSPAAIT